jgi:homogentisate 1,2-dioxygenase
MLSVSDQASNFAMSTLTRYQSGCIEHPLAWSVTRSVTTALHSWLPDRCADSTGCNQYCVLRRVTLTTSIAAPAGALRITTEFGVLNVLPGQIAVVQRGMRFSVALPGGPARGYVLEVFGGHFALPDLGLIGASPAVQFLRQSAAFVMLLDLGLIGALLEPTAIGEAISDVL